MKIVSELSNRLKGLTTAVARYSATTAFILLAVFVNAVAINKNSDFWELIMTCGIGALLCATLQAVQERFFSSQSKRIILMLIGIVLAVFYYWLIANWPDRHTEINIRSAAAMFMLFLLFSWIPSIKSQVSYNESFMVIFKSFFHTLFYSVILYGGLSLIIAAINLLITDVNEKAYIHTANIIFGLFAPIFFLSRIPVYPGTEINNSKIEYNAESEPYLSEATACPKFLVVLISYIVIPLTAIYTVILLLYIILNIRGKFWSNNLLEPLLVFYAITVILVYLLASRIEYKGVRLFRFIFPKLLIPIVLFQVVSSLLMIGDKGMTYERYYVILFGVFAVLSGVVMSIVPVRRNGIIAALLIGFTAISIMPPVDAFTISRISQIKLLEEVLSNNKMLVNNKITPNATILDQDKRKIAMTAEYLDRMGYTSSVPWMPEEFNVYEDFYDTFGFNQYDIPEVQNRNVYVSRAKSEAIDIAGYDVLARTYINSNDSSEMKISDLTNQGRNYQLWKEKSGDTFKIVLKDEDDLELISFDTDTIFKSYANFAVEKTELTNEEASFVAEGDQIRIKVIVEEGNMEIGKEQGFYYVDVYIAIDYK